MSKHDCTAMAVASGAVFLTGATGLMAILPCTGTGLDVVGTLTGDGTASCAASSASRIIATTAHISCHVNKACNDLLVLSAGTLESDVEAVV